MTAEFFGGIPIYRSELVPRGSMFLFDPSQTASAPLTSELLRAAFEKVKAGPRRDLMVVHPRLWDPARLALAGVVYRRTDDDRLPPRRPRRRWWQRHARHPRPEPLPYTQIMGTVKVSGTRKLPGSS